MGFLNTRKWLSSAAPLLLLSMLTKHSSKPEALERYLRVAVECQTDYPLTAEDMAAFKKAETFPAGYYAPCFAACFSNKLGMMDDNGKFSKPAIMQEVRSISDGAEEANFEKLVDYCLSSVNNKVIQHKDEKCERAKLGVQCFFDNAEKFNLKRKDVRVYLRRENFWRNNR